MTLHDYFIESEVKEMRNLFKPTKLSLVLLVLIGIGLWMFEYQTDRANGEPLVRKPTIDHIVIVVEENHSFKEIVGNKSAPYMNQLFKAGANLTNHYAVEHPSQPNYLDLFRRIQSGCNNRWYT